MLDPDRKNPTELLRTHPCAVCGATDWKEGATMVSALVRDDGRFYQTAGPFGFHVPFICQGCGQVLSFDAGSGPAGVP